MYVIFLPMRNFNTTEWYNSTYDGTSYSYIWLCTKPVRAVYRGCHLGGSGFTSLGPIAGHGEFPFSSGCIYPACDTRNALFGVAGAVEFSPGQYIYNIHFCPLPNPTQFWTVVNIGPLNLTVGKCCVMGWLVYI